MDDNRSVYQDSSGAWRWRIVAGNGRTIASSGESFASKANAQRALHRATEGHAPELSSDSEPFSPATKSDESEQPA